MFMLVITALIMYSDIEVDLEILKFLFYTSSSGTACVEEIWGASYFVWLVFFYAWQATIKRWIDSVQTEMVGFSNLAAVYPKIVSWLECLAACVCVQHIRMSGSCW